MSEISAVVLAGGQSRRLGANKAFIEIGGQTLIKRVLQTISPLTEDVIVVTSEAEPFRHLGVHLMGDVYPGKSSLGGIYSGLLAAKYQQALVVGCDMPFLNGALLRYMVSLAGEYEVIIPSYDSFLEPLHAIYHKQCLEPMRLLVEANRLRISEVFCKGRIRYITAEEIATFDPAHLSFFNINTPEDLLRARELAQSPQFVVPEEGYIR